MTVQNTMSYMFAIIDKLRLIAIQRISYDLAWDALDSIGSLMAYQEATPPEVTK